MVFTFKRSVLPAFLTHPFPSTHTPPHYQIMAGGTDGAGGGKKANPREKSGPDGGAGDAGLVLGWVERGPP